MWRRRCCERMTTACGSIFSFRGGSTGARGREVAGRLPGGRWQSQGHGRGSYGRGYGGLPRGSRTALWCIRTAAQEHRSISSWDRRHQGLWLTTTVWGGGGGSAQATPGQRAERSQQHARKHGGQLVNPPFDQPGLAYRKWWKAGCPPRAPLRLVRGPLVASATG